MSLLIVTDNEYLLRAGVNYLIGLGYRPIIETDINMAKQRVLREDEHIDVAIIDVQGKFSKILELFEVISAYNPRCVLFSSMSGQVTANDVHKVIYLKRKDKYYILPVDLIDLGTKLLKLIRI